MPLLIKNNVSNAQIYKHDGVWPEIQPFITVVVRVVIILTTPATEIGLIDMHACLDQKSIIRDYDLLIIATLRWKENRLDSSVPYQA